MLQTVLLHQCDLGYEFCEQEFLFCYVIGSVELDDHFILLC